MNTDRILQSTLIDIVFENRNKNYGAYPLRKFYNNRLYKALGMVLMLVIVLCLFSFLQPNAKTDFTTIPYVDDSKLVKPPIDKPVAPKSQPQKAAAPAPVLHNTVQSPVPLIVPDNKVPHAITTLSDSAVIGEHEVKGKPGGPLVVPLVTPGTGDPDPATVTPVDVNTPTGVAEVMPSYPGGPDALRKFLEKNLQNPQDLEDGQSVSVKIRFVVGYDGKLKSFETIEDGGAAFNNEVIRVLKKMPEWIPGKTRGQNLSVYYVLPVKFVSAE
jgi:protein TonB